MHWNSGKLSLLTFETKQRTGLLKLARNRFLVMSGGKASYLIGKHAKSHCLIRAVGKVSLVELRGTGRSSAALVAAKGESSDAWREASGERSLYEGNLVGDVTLKERFA